ncbi:MAG: acylneuraminate cytidylyltransferase family protein [Candidatus Omnitrophota bacterium]|nr:acylneuraminate cytidylyltransferase family protein [Candidatus Omnitrophota bacterium]
MYKNKSILAIIPARGGSKGLPQKNILPLVNKPLIAWTIKQALKSKYLDRVIVSTDSLEIARISKKYSAEIPFLRPSGLASDKAKMTDVVLHVIDWLKKRGKIYDLIMLLQPTSPLRSSEDIDKSIKLLFKKKARAIVSVCVSEHHPYWNTILLRNGKIKGFLKPEFIDKNRQQLPIFYRLNGAIYLAYTSYLKSYKSFLGSSTYAYIMSPERSVDIDSTFDFKFAEFLLSRKAF